jgi:hypothetical protein
MDDFLIDFDNYKPIFRTKNEPLIVSDKSEEKILSDLKLKIVGSIVLLVLIPFVEYYLYTNY